MSKISKKILTLLLVISMIFGVFATTVAAATSGTDGNASGSGSQGTVNSSGTSGESDVASGSMDNGWCKVEYEGNDIIVTLYPDAEELLGTNKGELKALLGFVAGAVKQVVFGEMLKDVLPEDAEIGDITLDPDNIWFEALDAYVEKQYDSSVEDKYMAFLEEAIDDDAKVEDFAKYVCSLIKAGVISGSVALSDLPNKTNINQKLEDLLNSEVDKYVKSRIEDTIDSFIDSLKGDTTAEVAPVARDYMVGEAREVISEYIAHLRNGTVSAGGDFHSNIEGLVEDYITAEIQTTIEEYVTAKLKGETPAASPANPYIEAYVIDEIDDRIDTYIAHKLAGTVPTDAVDVLVYEYADETVNDFLDDVVSDYVDVAKGTASSMDADLFAYIDAKVNAAYDADWIAYKAYKSGSGTAPRLYNYIEEKVRPEIAFLVAIDLGVTMTEALSMYDNGNVNAADYIDSVPAADIKTGVIADFTLDDYKYAIDLDANRATFVLEILGNAALVDNFRGAVDFSAALAKIGYANYDNLMASIVYADVEALMDNSVRADILEEISATYTDDKIVEILTDTISAIADDKLNELVADFKEDAYAEILVSETEYEYAGIEISIPALREKIKTISNIIGDSYRDTHDELADIPEGKLGYVKLLEIVNDITVDGESIYTDSANGKVFILEKIKEILRDHPTFEEVANMDDDEMFVDYVIGVTTDFCDSEFNLTLKIGSDFEQVRRIARVLNENVIITYTGDDVAYDITIPERFASAILKACEEGKVDEELRDKIFADFMSTPEGKHALLNSSTLAEVLDLFDDVTFETILDSSYVSRFEKLDGLTVEELKEKILGYEKAYDKVLGYLNRAFDKLPEEYKTKTLFDIYNEDTNSFYEEYDAKVDLVAAAGKVNSKYADFVEAFLDETVVESNISVKLTIEDVYKVTYKNGTEIVREGFLPVGADLAFFSGVSAFGDKTIISWIDDAGTVYEKMPEDDIVLYAVLEDAEAILTSDKPETTYGDTITLSVILTTNYPMTGATYTWYHGTTMLVEDSAEGTYVIDQVADSGSYYCVVKLNDADGEEITLTTTPAEVTINPVVIDVSAAIDWSDDLIFTFDEAEHGVTVEILDEYKTLISLDPANLTNAVATNAGDYVAKAVFTLVDAANYVFLDAKDYSEQPWTIGTKKYDESDLSAWGQLTFEYEYGVTHTVTAPTGPVGLDIAITGNSNTDAGTYTATITVTSNNANIEWVGAATISKEWTITAKAIDLSTLVWQAFNGVDDIAGDDKFTFVYSKNEQGVTLVLDNLPDDLAAAIVMANNTAVNTTGEVLTATATVNTDGNKIATNYNFNGTAIPSQNWEIVKDSIGGSAIVWSEDVEFVYNTEAQAPELLYVPADINPNYTYYNEAGAVIAKPTDAGKYKVTINLTTPDDDNYYITGIENLAKEVEFEIVKAVIKPAPEWDYTEPFEYNSRLTRNVYLKAFASDAEKLSVVYSGDLNKKTLGNYTTVATITLKDEYKNNYVLEDENLQADGSIVVECNWTIKKIAVVIPELDWNYDENNPPIYNGKQHTVDYDDAFLKALGSYSSYLKVEDTGDYSGTNAGEYTAIVTFKLNGRGAANYEFPADTAGISADGKTVVRTLTWRIVPISVSLPALEWIGEKEYKFDGTNKVIVLDETPIQSLIDDNIVKVVYSDNDTPDAGRHTAKAVIELVDKVNYAFIEGTVSTYSFNWRITPKVIDIDVFWQTPDILDAIYDGTERPHPTINLDNVPDEYKALFDVKYTDMSTGEELVVIDAGVYRIKAEFVSKTGNYIINDNLTTVVYEWEIFKGDFDLSKIGVSFKDFSVMYDGKYHSIPIFGVENLADYGITYSFDCENSYKDVGTYLVTATFNINDPNYVDTVLIASLVIYETEGTKNFYSYGDSLHITSESGLPADYEMHVSDNTEANKDADFSAITPDGFVANLGVSYDITFTKPGANDGDREPVNLSGDFIVRLQIPYSLRTPDTRDLRIVHIADDGTVTLIDNVIRSGYYLVFEVNHFSTYAIIDITEKSSDGPDTPTPPTCNHVDENGDLRCDICGEKLPCNDHVDENGDGYCDNCGDRIPTPPACDHVDADNDGICDKCDEEIPDCDHYDSDNDGYCDDCGEKVPGCSHVDVNGDGYCDNCGSNVVPPDSDKEYYFADSLGNVDIYVSTGLGEDISLSVQNKTGAYTDLDLSAIAGEGYKGYLGAAYDIKFYENGSVAVVSGDFVVRLLIPENLRSPSTRDLRVVYIAPDGTLEEIDSKRSGEYLVFETTHFSVYSIVEIVEDGAIAPPADDDNVADTPDVKDFTEADTTWLWIIIILLVIDLGAIAVIIIKKKRNSDDDDDEPKEEPVAPAPVEEEPVVEEPVVEEPVAVEEPAPVVEEPVAEPIPFVPPIAAGSDDDESTGRRLVNGQIVPVRYRTSFMSRLIQSEPPIQDYYTVVKNALLSYKGVKARTSWNFESFNKGRIQCAKLNVKGNAFQVYLGLDPKEYSAEKYHFIDVSDKPKLDKVPMMLKVKSDRALKYSLELVDEVMKKNGIEQGEIPNDDYHLPYETTEALVDRDLVKVILPEGMIIDENTVIEKLNVGDFLKDALPEEPVVEEPAVDESQFLHVDAVVADTIMSDEEAKEIIETIVRTGKKSATSKMVEVNIDTLCENYENGDTVDIDNLKEKSLVSKKADKVKVLARGVMTKRLTVVADKFSIQAVKMIGLAGGRAQKYKD